MNDKPLRKCYEIQWYHGRILVTRQSNALPRPRSGSVLVKMTACGICGADIRAITGNKATDSVAYHHVTLGHEGVGRIVALGSKVSGFSKGDCVVILPHILPSSSHTNYTDGNTQQINPDLIGLHKTLHMGWDLDGCFADYVIVPATNIVRVDPMQLRQSQSAAPDLGEAIFAMTEPMLCTLTSYRLIEEWLGKFGWSGLTPGRALVIGCGPIGMFHALVLLKRGFEVWMMDAQPRRAQMARWLLKNRVQVTSDPTKHVGKFHLVMVTPSSAEAIMAGEQAVCDKGILYLFSGLNKSEREIMDSERVFFYEKIHRYAKGMLTNTRLVSGEKTILYLGHSGYYQSMANEAIAMIAENAEDLSCIVTGVIRGWESPCIGARLPGGTDWMTEDASPAIISVLTGLDLRDRHCKLLVLADYASGPGVLLA